MRFSSRLVSVVVGLCLLCPGLPGLSVTYGEDDNAACEAASYPKERRDMVGTQIRSRGVEDAAVLNAMRSVPRHCFVPPAYVDQAYADHPLPIGLGQTISQPYIVALMTELLRLKPSDKVLEIGTGSGYQAAVLARIARQVYSIEIHPSLAKEAAGRLAAQGFRNVQVRSGDGYFGWKEHAPYDAIIVTAAPSEIPPALIDQLKPGGRMCIPVGSSFGIQELKLLTKDKNGSVSMSDMAPVRFVPLLRDDK